MWFFIIDLEFYVRTRAYEKRESGKQPLEITLLLLNVRYYASGNLN